MTGLFAWISLTALSTTFLILLNDLLVQTSLSSEIVHCMWNINGFVMAFVWITYKQEQSEGLQSLAGRISHVYKLYII